jgi:hypothetical protein
MVAKMIVADPKPGPSLDEGRMALSVTEGHPVV